MDVSAFNSWQRKQLDWSAVEGDLFLSPSLGPLVVPAGETVEICAGQGLHHGGGPRAVSATAGNATFSIRDTSIRLSGPLHAGDVLRELSDHVHKEIGRNVVLCHLLRIVADLASANGFQCQDTEQLVARTEQRAQVPTGLDVYGLLPAPVSLAQLLQLVKHVHLGPGLPDMTWAYELNMVPDPCDKMSPRQLHKAVQMAQGGGGTYLEGLVPVGEDKDGVPVYLTKWSRPFA